jgi:hypothetical protein
VTPDTECGHFVEHFSSFHCRQSSALACAQKIVVSVHLSPPNCNKKARDIKNVAGFVQGQADGELSVRAMA